jgi:hypothetical protein
MYAEDASIHKRRPTSLMTILTEQPEKGMLASCGSLVTSGNVSRGVLLDEERAAICPHRERDLPARMPTEGRPSPVRHVIATRANAYSSRFFELAQRRLI